MQRKSLLILFALLSSFVISCTKPPAVPICLELNLDRAFCVNTITADEFTWDSTHPFEGKTYWEARPSNLIVPASSWAKIKEFIIKSCKQSNKCDDVASWDRTIGAIDTGLEKKGK